MEAGRPLLALDLVRGFVVLGSANLGSVGFQSLVTKVPTSYTSAIRHSEIPRGQWTMVATWPLGLLCHQ